MPETTIFSGITRSDAEKLKLCFGAEKNAYMQNEHIVTYNREHLDTVGFVAGGEIIINGFNSEGTLLLTERSKQGEMFGELFGFPPANSLFTVSAATDCEIIFFDYSKIIRPCQNACYYHTVFVNNLFRMTAEKSGKAKLHLAIVSQRSLRSKIYAFLLNQFNLLGKNPFEISMSQTELAMYLCVDRSAMAREIAAMRKDGIIRAKGQLFELLNVK